MVAQWDRSHSFWFPMLPHTCWLCTTSIVVNWNIMEWMTHWAWLLPVEMCMCDDDNVWQRTYITLWHAVPHHHIVIIQNLKAMADLHVDWHGIGRPEVRMELDTRFGEWYQIINKYLSFEVEIRMEWVKTGFIFGRLFDSQTFDTDYCCLLGCLIVRTTLVHHTLHHTHIHRVNPMDDMMGCVQCERLK